VAVNCKFSFVFILNLSQFAGELEKTIAECSIESELETETKVVRRLKNILDKEIQEISTLKRNVSRTLQEYTSLKRSHEVSSSPQASKTHLINLCVCISVTEKKISCIIIR